MSKGRSALLVATSSYDNRDLQQLRSPGRDIEGLATILQDQRIGDFEVRTVVDREHYEVNRAIEEFFLQRRRSDFLLLHISCHGILNNYGELYFAARDTDRTLLAATAVSSAYLRTQMDRCRARSIVVLLDCCYSGAFLRGAKSDTDVHITEELAGRGRAILTATNHTEYAWEGDHFDELEPEPSRFTGAVIDGLRSGQADGDRDGLVSVHDLYEYVCEQMRAAQVSQSPQLSVEVENQLVIARSLLKGRQQKEGSRRAAANTRRYQLGQMLGSGGMAEVHLGHDTRLGRTVAVKRLRADLARDPSFLDRFRREAQSAASLSHPAIVAVYDTGEEYVDGVSIPYIVMEYIDGSTLRELLNNGRKVVPETVMAMTIGILQGLQFAHRNGVVHRDIKPSNVMLSRDGQVKVMDFGIGGAVGDSGMTMRQTAAVLGTVQYIAPEQAKGEQVDARSDLYSTGCLLYEALTLRPPFVGDSPLAVAYMHVREEAQPPSVFDPIITPEMDAIVLKALVKDPNYRYQSADEMRADIEACLDGHPVTAATAEEPSSRFWFAVPEPRPLLSETSKGRIGRLEPGQWYLAVGRRGSALVVHQEGRRGLLADLLGIQRAEEDS